MAQVISRRDRWGPRRGAASIGPATSLGLTKESCVPRLAARRTDDGRSYSRAAACFALALLIVAGAILPQAARAQTPVIVHSPQASAFAGRAIPVDVTTSCAPAAICSAALYYRDTR